MPLYYFFSKQISFSMWPYLQVYSTPPLCNFFFPKMIFSGCVTDKAISDLSDFHSSSEEICRREMYIQLRVFKCHSLVKISIWGFFSPYSILPPLLTSFFTIFLTNFQSALFDIIYISFTALNLFFQPLLRIENLNLVFVIICFTETSMGPRWNQNSILLAQIHAEKQYLLWRLDNNGIQTWTPQRDMHFKRVVRQEKNPNRLPHTGSGNYHENWSNLPRCGRETPLLRFSWCDWMGC